MSSYGKVYSTSQIATNILDDLTKNKITNKRFIGKRPIFGKHTPKVVGGDGDVTFGVGPVSGGKGACAFNASTTTDYIIGLTITDSSGFTLFDAYKLIKTADASNPTVIFFYDSIEAFKEGNTTVTAIQGDPKNPPPTPCTVLANYAVRKVVNKANTTIYATGEGAVGVIWEVTASSVTFTVRSELQFPVSVIVTAKWASPSSQVTKEVSIPAYTGDWSAVDSPPRVPVTGDLSLENRPLELVSITLLSYDTSTAFVQRVLAAMMKPDYVNFDQPVPVKKEKKVLTEAEKKINKQNVKTLQNIVEYLPELQYLKKIPGVTHLSSGMKITNGEPTSQPAVMIFVAAKYSEEQLRSMGREILPKYVDSPHGKIATDVILD